MPLPLLLQAFSELPEVRRLSGALPPRGAALGLGVLPGSSAAVLLATLVTDHPNRLFVVLTPTPSDAERWLADLSVLLPEPAAALYPQRESLGEEEPHYEIAGERVETLERLAAGAVSVLVTTARASAERSLMPAALEAVRVELVPGAGGGDDESGGLSGLVRRLMALGYTRVPHVSDVAQFAVRGGVLDVYGFGMAQPVRAEYWGDECLALRSFDLTTQRSTGPLERASVLPVDAARTLRALRGGEEGGGVGAGGAAGEGGTGEGRAGTGELAPIRRTLLDLLSADALLVEDAPTPAALEEQVMGAWADAERHAELARRRGEEVPPREDLLVDPERWSRSRGLLARLCLWPPVELALPIGPAPAIERDLARLRPAPGGETLVLCDNEGQLERLEELLEGGDGKPAGGPGRGARGVPAGVTLAIGALDGGFALPALTVVSDHEIFRRARRLRRPRRYRQASSAAFGTLSAGDYVVHLEHGVGIYRGMRTIELDAGDAGDGGDGGDGGKGGIGWAGGSVEVAVVEYEGGDLLHVPLYRIDQLEPYRAIGEADGVGPAPAPPRLHRLGGTRWRRQRERAERGIRRMAAELLELYARRATAPGYAFPADTRWQRELESSFLYEDTPDQRAACDEVKRDMESPRPMDRLVVGDAGYGKTEVAVRASFKAVEAGKQVVVLVPTTILAEQHGRTFRERLADYPVRVEVLSRFRTSEERRAVLVALAAGGVDVLIGTHRVLSPDVRFRDLALVVVDEEHRFGVEHKERLKQLRLSVDVLTLTATPIPRTLHLSLAGLRDLTLIETPPRDRSPVLTFVEPWDDELIEEALARELDRGGQVYFVHNRIETIESVAERVRRLAPRASLGVAHGSMRPHALDGVMRRFVAGEVQVLVSTMIVESGLDVPNANTMVVHQADRYGLAQLYQLRGRVGRGHRRAYCYLLAPVEADPAAEERLRVLEHHSELGAGYRIALRDLELRGSGNLLGAEQSGFVHAVGFETYLRLLEQTVRALKGEAARGAGAPFAPPEVLLDRPAFLPDRYVEDDGAKLDVYRRLARSRLINEIDLLGEEIADRFGRLPEEAEALLALTRLRVLGARLGLETVLVRSDGARLTFRADAVPRLASLKVAVDEVQFRAEVRRAIPLVLWLQRLGGMPLLPGLVRALSRALANPTR